MRRSMPAEWQSPKIEYTDFSKGMEYTNRSKIVANPRMNLIKNMNLDTDGKLSVRKPLIPTATNITGENANNAMPAGYEKIGSVYAPFVGLTVFPYLTFYNDTTKNQAVIRYMLDNSGNSWLEFRDDTKVLDKIIFNKALYPNKYFSPIFQPGVNSLLLNGTEGIIELTFTVDHFQTSKLKSYQPEIGEIQSLGINLYGDNVMFIQNVVEDAPGNGVTIGALFPYKYIGKSTYSKDIAVSPENYAYDANVNPTDKLIIKPLLYIPKNILEKEIGVFFTSEVIKDVVTGNNTVSLKFIPDKLELLKSVFSTAAPVAGLNSLCPTWTWTATDANQSTTGNRLAKRNLQMPLFMSLLHNPLALAKFYESAKTVLNIPTSLILQHNLEELCAPIFKESDKFANGYPSTIYPDVCQVLDVSQQYRYDLSIKFEPSYDTSQYRETAFSIGSSTVSGIIDIEFDGVSLVKEGRVFGQLKPDGTVYKLDEVVSALNPANKQLLLRDVVKQNGVKISVKFGKTGDTKPTGLLGSNVHGLSLSLPQFIDENNILNVNRTHPFTWISTDPKAGGPILGTLETTSFDSANKLDYTPYTTAINSEAATFLKFRDTMAEVIHTDWPQAEQKPYGTDYNEVKTHLAKSIYVMQDPAYKNKLYGESNYNGSNTDWKNNYPLIRPEFTNILAFYNPINWSGEISGETVTNLTIPEPVQISKIPQLGFGAGVATAPGWYNAEIDTAFIGATINNEMSWIPFTLQDHKTLPESSIPIKPILSSATTLFPSLYFNKPTGYTPVYNQSRPDWRTTGKFNNWGFPLSTRTTWDEHSFTKDFLVNPFQITINYEGESPMVFSGNWNGRNTTRNLPTQLQRDSGAAGLFDYNLNQRTDGSQFHFSELGLDWNSISKNIERYEKENPKWWAGSADDYTLFHNANKLKTTKTPNKTVSLINHGFEFPKVFNGTVSDKAITSIDILYTGMPFYIPNIHNSGEEDYGFFNQYIYSNGKSKNVFCRITDTFLPLFLFGLNGFTYLSQGSTKLNDSEFSSIPYTLSSNKSKPISYKWDFTNPDNLFNYWEQTGYYGFPTRDDEGNFLPSNYIGLSDINNPTYVPATKLLDVFTKDNAPITLALPWRDNLVVFTSLTTSMFIGRVPDKQQLINANVGVPLRYKNSVQVVSTSIIFKNRDDVFALVPSQGTDNAESLSVRNISQQISPLLLQTEDEFSHGTNVIKSITYNNDEYWLIYANKALHKTRVFRYRFSKFSWSMDEYPIYLDEFIKTSEHLIIAFDEGGVAYEMLSDNALNFITRNFVTLNKPYDAISTILENETDPVRKANLQDFFDKHIKTQYSGYNIDTDGQILKNTPINRDMVSGSHYSELFSDVLDFKDLDSLILQPTNVIIDNAAKTAKFLFGTNVSGSIDIKRDAFVTLKTIDPTPTILPVRVNFDLAGIPAGISGMTTAADAKLPDSYMDWLRATDNIAYPKNYDGSYALPQVPNFQVLCDGKLIPTDCDFTVDLTSLTLNFSNASDYDKKLSDEDFQNKIMAGIARYVPYAVNQDKTELLATKPTISLIKNSFLPLPIDYEVQVGSRRPNLEVNSLIDEVTIAVGNDTDNMIESQHVEIYADNNLYTTMNMNIENSTQAIKPVTGNVPWEVGNSTYARPLASRKTKKVMKMADAVDIHVYGKTSDRMFIDGISVSFRPSSRKRF